MRIFNSLIVPKNLKEETLLNFLTFVLLQNIKKMKGGPFGDIKKFSKISLKKPKRGEGESHIVEKSENLLLRKFCLKKLAHRHGFEPGPSGLKSKHLTARPKKSELCDLRSETRELSRGKKNSHFPITLAYPLEYTHYYEIFS